MKYIRTKDKIYEVIEELTDGRVKVRLFPKLNVKKVIAVNDIIKQADTIEELCENFVFSFETRKLKYVCWKYDDCNYYYIEHDADARFFDLDDDKEDKRKDRDRYGKASVYRNDMGCRVPL